MCRGEWSGGSSGCGGARGAGRCEHFTWKREAFSGFVVKTFWSFCVQVHTIGPTVCPAQLAEGKLAHV